MSKVNIAGYKIEKDPTAPNLITDPQGGSSDLPSGGTTGQVLTKLSDDDGDAGWEDPTGDTDITMSVTVDGSTGTPAATVTKTMVQDVINFLVAFTGLKGETGARGLQGPRGATGAPGASGQDGSDGITPVVTAQATVDSTSGNPSVTVAKTGTDVAPIFTFNFSGLKGEQGIPGTGEDGVGITSIAFDHVDAQGNNVYVVTLSNSQTYTFTANTGATPDVSVNATVDAQTGTPGVTVTKTGSVQQPVFNLAFTGLKGEQGPAGQSAEIDAVFGGNTGDLTQVEYDSTNRAIGLTMDDNGTTRSVVISLDNELPSGGSVGNFLQKTATGPQWAAMPAGSNGKMVFKSSLTCGYTLSSDSPTVYFGDNFSLSGAPFVYLDSFTLPYEASSGDVRPGYISCNLDSGERPYVYLEQGTDQYDLYLPNYDMIVEQNVRYNGSIVGTLFTKWTVSQWYKPSIAFILQPECWIEFSATVASGARVTVDNTSSKHSEGSSVCMVLSKQSHYPVASDSFSASYTRRTVSGTAKFYIQG